MDKVTRKKVGDFCVECNHTLTPFPYSVIFTYKTQDEEGRSIIKVVLYVSGERVVERDVLIRAIGNGVPKLMAVAVAKELVKEYKDKEREILEGKNV